MFYYEVVRYYFKENGKQILDLTGNLILSFNSSLVKCRAPSAAPHAIKDAKKIMINELTFIKKIAATFIVLGFIWGKNKALVETDTALNKPYVKPPIDAPARCVHLHENKGYCIHINNLDNSCIGYDECKDYEVEYNDPNNCQCENGGDCSECPR